MGRHASVAACSSGRVRLRITFAAATLAVLSLCQTVRAAEPQSVDVPSLDRVGDALIQQPSFWFRASVPGRAADSAPGRAPAMVLLHGCGGPYRDALPQRLSQRMREYAELLNAHGIHVLVTDSLTPRGERELCTQKVGTRKVTQTQRRRDALGALQWLAAQPEVDAARVGLLGWSNGGSNVLAASNLRHPEVANAPVKPTFAVAYYPGCEDELKRGYQPAMPLLMLLGAADDWTPAAPCERLAEQSAAPKPQVESYAGAYHGFDGTAALRLRRDVPNGARPGAGVHQGGDPAARTASRERLLQFVRDAVAPR